MKCNSKEIEFLFLQKQRGWATKWVSQEDHVRRFCLEAQVIMVRRGEQGSWEELIKSPVYDQMVKLFTPEDRHTFYKIWQACYLAGQPSHN